MVQEGIVDKERQLTDLLLDLYAQQLAVQPDDKYLLVHSQPDVVATQVAVFEFYSRYLSHQDCVLDWGCRHAPDSCLLRATFGTDMHLAGCDLDEVGSFDMFHNYANLDFDVLPGAFGLPYEDETFDTIVASGTLEHVAMDYESLKELYRVLKVHGRLIITYLPNRLSFEEWYQRTIKKDWYHRRLYGFGEIVRLVKRVGFLPKVAGYQTRLDLLSAKSLRHRVLRAASYVLPMHWFSSTLCLVLQKVHMM